MNEHTAIFCVSHQLSAKLRLRKMIPPLQTRTVIKSGKSRKTEIDILHARSCIYLLFHYGMYMKYFLCAWYLDYCISSRVRRSELVLAKGNFVVFVLLAKNVLFPFLCPKTFYTICRGGSEFCCVQNIILHSTRFTEFFIICENEIEFSTDAHRKLKTCQWFLIYCTVKFRVQ